MEQNYPKILETARKCKKTYKHLQASGFSGNLRIETANRLGMSVVNADRYRTFGTLTPIVQPLARDYNVGMSSLQILAPHSPFEQQVIYDMLTTVANEGITLARDFINHVVSFYHSSIHS